MAKQSKKTKATPGKAPTRKPAAGHPLERLYQTIHSRKGADPDSSYTARLMAKGPIKLAQKVGEEAIETAIEGVLGDRKKLVAESADLFYHLLALWAVRNVKPQQIWDELARREGQSGLAEKAARTKKPARTKKAARAKKR